MDRRDFLKMIGVASGTGVLAGCNLDRKTEKLIPYLVPPDDAPIPGDAVYSASTCTECPVGCGLSVTNKDSRPTKLDGLSGHPVNDGALCVRGQASLWRLYDTERIRQPMVRDGAGKLAPATWQQALTVIADALGTGQENVFLSGRTSGTISGLIDQFCSRLGVTRLPEFEPFGFAAIRDANRRLFGRAVMPYYKFDEADLVLTVGADVLDTFASPVGYSRSISRAHSKQNGHFTWYHAEPHVSTTGFRSDHRLSLRPGTEAHLLAFLLHQLRTRRVFNDRRLEDHLSAVQEVTPDDAASATGLSRHQLETLASEMISARHPLVVAGGVATRQAGGAAVANMAALLQYALGTIGETVDFRNGPDYSRVGDAADLDDLAGRLDAGDVGVLLVAGADPVAHLPGRFDPSKAALSVGIGTHLTDTLERCQVVLPESHGLESWGDVEPQRGVVSAIQPAIEPFHDTRSLGDILLQAMAAAGRGLSAESYQTYLYDAWRRRFGESAAGVLIKEGFMTYRPAGGDTSVSLSARKPDYTAKQPPSGTVAVVAPSLRFYDGRSRAIPLLREIPEPLSSVTWDAWVSASAKKATELGLKDGDWVSLSSGDWSVDLPVMKQPGLHDDVLMVEQGSVGVPSTIVPGTGELNAVVAGVSVRKVEKKGHLAYLAGSKVSETEGYIPLQHIPHHSHDTSLKREDITFFPVPDYPDYRWAMAVDLDKCTGCSACVSACYIENNVPVVGREEHLKGREMSWIAVQPYYNEDETLEVMPVMCQHCDAAPCEPVCPVFATYHNDQGLNAQVYNRCVGTRYCSNNCPYKVRRFNWFDHRNRPKPLDQLFNPDVSRRGKGIMEKCSFCVQRIRKARDTSKDEKRKIGADEVVTACQQTCPAEAIVFGNILDENSKVARLARSDHSHQALEELGTGPAVYYLTRKGNGNDHG
ncbi:MAG: molybdopterin-dependent oxidoreductase [Candidatus Latescibacterota bacterium]|jgi:molybdopterin-containing oxidoreductase family iron-sulfur binding subunit